MQYFTIDRRQAKLDARGAISITERAAYIGRVRALASGVARLYAKQREDMGYPMLKK